MKFKIMTLFILTVVILTACGTTEGGSQDLSDEEIKSLVHDYSISEGLNETASITSTELIITDSNENETVYDLPEDEFFLSVAPFIQGTHPCEIHSLTGCQGELVNEAFDVHIEDEKGNIIVDETMKSMDNGFIDLWLPRDETFNVNISYNGKETTSNISTFKEDGTCVTTMQLM